MVNFFSMAFPSSEKLFLLPPGKTSSNNLRISYRHEFQESSYSISCMRRESRHQFPLPTARNPGYRLTINDAPHGAEDGPLRHEKKTRVRTPLWPLRKR